MGKSFESNAAKDDQVILTKPDDNFDNETLNNADTIKSDFQP